MVLYLHSHSLLTPDKAFSLGCPVAKDVHLRIVRHVALNVSGYIPEGTETAPAPPTEEEPPSKQGGRDPKESKAKESQDKHKEKETKDKPDKKTKDTPKKGARGKQSASSQQPARHSYESSPEPPERPTHRERPNGGLSVISLSLCHVSSWQ
eukprot:EG_transcript_30918